LATNSVTLDDLECQNREFYGFVWQFWAMTQISRVNCAEINWDRHGESAYEIFFSIERRFRQFKSRFSRFKETCAQGHQKAVSP